MSLPLPLSEQFRSLEQLQELDLRIDQLQKKKLELPVALKPLQVELARLSTAMIDRQNQCTEFEKAERQAKAAIELNQERVTRANSKLETVGNTQEFQAASKEQEQLKKFGANLDEQLKKISDDIARVKSESQKLDLEKRSVEKKLELENQGVNQQVGGFDKELSELGEKRAVFSANVERRILAQYDRVRGNRAGLGFVPALSGRCSGCNMFVPAQLFNQILRMAEVHQCPSCHRILYAKVEARSG